MGPSDPLCLPPLPQMHCLHVIPLLTLLPSLLTLMVWVPAQRHLLREAFSGDLDNEDQLCPPFPV